jgi:hypothetical protein
MTLVGENLTLQNVSKMPFLKISGSAGGLSKAQSIGQDIKQAV